MTGRRETASGRTTRRTRNASRSPARKKSPSREAPKQERRSSSRSRTKRTSSPPSTSSKSAVTSPDFKGFERRTTRASERIIENKKREKPVSLDSDSDNPDPIQEIKEKPKIAVRGRSRQTDDVFQPAFDGKMFEAELRKKLTNLTRRSTRSSEPIEVDRIIKYDKKLSEFSDEDDVSVKKESSEDQFREFGGAIGAFVLMLFFPIYVFGLHIFCNESSCSFKLGVNYKQSLNLEKFFDLKSCLIYVGYALFVGILSIIPFGGKKIAGLPNKNGKLQYVTNGLFITCSLLVFCYVLEYRKIPVFLYLTKNYLRFLLPSLIFGIAFCLLGYYHSFYVPVSALSQSSMVNSKIYNIFMGREVNPRFFGILDTKVFFIRLSLIASVLLNYVYFHQSVKLTWSATDTKAPQNVTDWLDIGRLLAGINIRLNPTVAVLCGQNIVMLLNRIIFESQWVSSFEIQYEGFGYPSTVGYALYPFIVTLSAKYAYDFGLIVPAWQLVVSSITFLIGFGIFTKSNRIKDAFRKNPYDVKLKGLETMPTSQGKKLIVSGLWGTIRHPNHLGFILMNLAMLPFVWNVPPVTTIVFTVLHLFYRCIRDNKHCSMKYGSSWDRYCQKVKYMLIPKVY